MLSYSKPPAAETVKAWYDALPDGIFSTHCDFIFYPLDKEPDFSVLLDLLVFFKGLVFFTHSDRPVSSLLVTRQTCELHGSADQNTCTPSRQSPQLGSKQTSSTELQQLVHRDRLDLHNRQRLDESLSCSCRQRTLAATARTAQRPRGLWWSFDASTGSMMYGVEQHSCAVSPTQSRDTRQAS